MASYRLQPAAEIDLEIIWDQSAEHWGIPQADRYIDELDDCFQLLASNPLLA
jgi:toxin ParE1/3/4